MHLPEVVATPNIELVQPVGFGFGLSWQPSEPITADFEHGLQPEFPKVTTPFSHPDFFFAGFGAVEHGLEV